MIQTIVQEYGITAMMNQQAVRVPL